MSDREDEKPNVKGQDPFDPASQTLPEIPTGLDRRKFIVRSAVISAAAVMNGCTKSETESQGARAHAGGARRPAGPAVPLSPDLEVVKKAKGPVMTVLDEFYKVGPGPSSSHTIGPMRITYDFYQRCTKLPADQLAKATALKVQPVWQPQRHGKGARHRARLTRGTDRQRTGHGRSEVPRQLDRTTRTRRSR